jgi:lysophospholipase L1-like esterase
MDMEKPPSTSPEAADWDHLIKRRRTKLLLFEIAAVVGGLIVLVGVFEIVLEFPGTLQSIKDRFDLAVASRPGAFDGVDVLIVCVGDSHTAGAEAPRGKDYPTQLQERLRASDPARTVRVLNFASSGANSSRAANTAIRFLEASSRAPDAVLFLAGYNNHWNIDDAAILPEEVRRKGKHAKYEYLIARTHLYKFSQITAARLRTVASGCGSPYPDNLFAVDRDAATVEFLADWIRIDLERLREACARRGTHLVLLTYWDPCQWTDPVFAEYTAAHRLLFVDVRGFGGSDPTPLLGGQGHPNALGYARIAEMIARAFRLRPEVLRRVPPIATPAAR